MPDNLRHPNIVPVYDSGEDGGRFYIATAFIAGHTLQKELDDNGGRPLDGRRAVQIVRQLADALSYAHQNGIVHCDIKPSNVMIDERDNPLVADFGLARRQRSGAVGEGSSGNPAFMAPEQWDGNAQAASDQYSLGVTLYQLLTGVQFAARPAGAGPRQSHRLLGFGKTCTLRLHAAGTGEHAVSA